MMTFNQSKMILYYSYYRLLAYYDVIKQNYFKITFTILDNLFVSFHQEKNVDVEFQVKNVPENWR